MVVSSLIRRGILSIPRHATATLRNNATTTTIKKSTKTALLSRCMSTNTSATFDLTGSFETYNLETAPQNTIECTKDEIMSYFQTMYTMRRMEITCDNEYKARNIRGFCHLYDGQEAVATGIDASFTKADSWITSYRCHCIALIRGGSVSKVIGELFGLEEGYSQAKGGSMHFYNKEWNFYGGQGIVGAQVPVGTGLAFANKYNTPPGEKMPVAIACFGDGAANQGQVWESANMAALWKLPMIFALKIIIMGWERRLSDIPQIRITSRWEIKSRVFVLMV